MHRSNSLQALVIVALYLLAALAAAGPALGTDGVLVRLAGPATAAPDDLVAYELTLGLDLPGPATVRLVVDLSDYRRLTTPASWDCAEGYCHAELDLAPGERVSFGGWLHHFAGDPGDHRVAWAAAEVVGGSPVAFSTWRLEVTRGGLAPVPGPVGPTVSFRAPPSLPQATPAPFFVALKTGAGGEFRLHVFFAEALQLTQVPADWTCDAATNYCTAALFLAPGSSLSLFGIAVPGETGRHWSHAALTPVTAPSDLVAFDTWLFSVHPNLSVSDAAPGVLHGVGPGSPFTRR